MDDDCLTEIKLKLTVLEAKMGVMETLLENQANILKYVVTPLILVIGVLAGVQLAI